MHLAILISLAQNHTITFNRHVVQIEVAEFRLHYRELLGHVRRLLDRLADCAKLIGMGSGVG